MTVYPLQLMVLEWEVEERLARTLVRAEAAEAENDEVQRAVDAVRVAEKAAREELEGVRASTAREIASKGQTIEALRDALTASEEMLAQVCVSACVHVYASVCMYECVASRTMDAVTELFVTVSRCLPRG